MRRQVTVLVCDTCDGTAEFDRMKTPIPPGWFCVHVELVRTSSTRELTFCPEHGTEVRRAFEKSESYK